MNRDEMVARVRNRKGPWDIVVIGGGATGAGIAVDAATRGHDVLLLEREDFGKGTSSRATKLVHGGVRYLEQGNLSLVMEALKERGVLLRNAPHIVRNLRFVVPNYSWWEAPFYGIGMKVYDLLAGKYSFGKSKTLSLEETLELLPTIRQDGLRGVAFGNFLIKQVVEELKAEFAQLKRFSTLSPVPGFRQWLDKRLVNGSDPDAAPLPQLESDGWWNDPAQSEKLRVPLLRLCARYLTRRPSIRIDSVSRFHLGNGARLERINWLGNTAPRGIQESFGIMVNYLYDLETIESNHEAFVNDGTVMRSAAVDALLTAESALALESPGNTRP